MRSFVSKNIKNFILNIILMFVKLIQYPSQQSNEQRTNEVNFIFIIMFYMNNLHFKYILTILEDMYIFISNQLAIIEHVHTV